VNDVTIATRNICKSDTVRIGSTKSLNNQFIFVNIGLIINIIIKFTPIPYTLSMEHLNMISESVTEMSVRVIKPRSGRVLAGAPEFCAPKLCAPKTPYGMAHYICVSSRKIFSSKTSLGNHKELFYQYF